MGKNEIKIPKGSLRDLYEKQNLSISKLVDIYDCGETTIQRKLHKYNIRVRPPMSIRLSIPKNKIKFLYEEKKKSTTQLAKSIPVVLGLF